MNENIFKSFEEHFDSASSQSRKGKKSQMHHHKVSDGEYEKLRKRSGLKGRVYMHRIDPKKGYDLSNIYFDKRSDGIPKRPKTKWGFYEERTVRKTYRKTRAAKAGWATEGDFLKWTFETGYRPEYEFRQVQDGEPGPGTCVWGLFKDIPIEEHIPEDPLDMISAEINLDLKNKFREELRENRMSMTLYEYTEFVVNEWEAGHIKSGMHLKRIDHEKPFGAGNAYFAYLQESGNVIHGFYATDVYRKFRTFVKKTGSQMGLKSFIEMALCSGFWPGKSQKIRDDKVYYGDPVSEREKAELQRILDLWKRADVKEEFETIDKMVRFAVNDRFNFCCTLEKRCGRWLCDIFVQSDYEKYTETQGYIELNVKLRESLDVYQRKLDALRMRAKIEKRVDPDVSDEIGTEWSGPEGQANFKIWCLENQVFYGERNMICRIDRRQPFGPDNCYVKTKLQSAS